MRKPEWQTCSLKKAIIRMWGAAEVEIRPLLWFPLSLLNIVNASPVHAVHIAEVLREVWTVSGSYQIKSISFMRRTGSANTATQHQRKTEKITEAECFRWAKTIDWTCQCYSAWLRHKIRNVPQPCLTEKSTPSAAKLEPHNWSTWCIFDGHLMCWGPKKLLSVKGRPHITSSNFRSLSKVNLIWKSSEIMQRCIEWLPGIVHRRASSAS